MIIIALKGAIRDSNNLLPTLRTVSNTYAEVARAQSCANHRALIMCYTMCATWYEGTAQLFSLIELKSIYFGFILLAETITRRRRGENGRIRRKALTNFRKCHKLKKNIRAPTKTRTCIALGAGKVWFVGCLTSQQQACLSQGRICSDNFTIKPGQCQETETR